MVVLQLAIEPDRAASIRAARDPATTSLAVDLDAITQDERDLLADHDGRPVPVTTPTIEDLFAALRASAAEELELLTEILDAHRDVLRERRVRTWQKPIAASDDETYTVAEPDWPEYGRGAARTRDWTPVIAKHRDEIHEITHGDEAAAWTRELEAINKEARERALNQWYDAGRAEDRAREEGIARLKEWAIENGSERVRLLIEENMATWYGLAEDEYFAHHTPAGFTPLTDDDDVRALPVPDVPDILALREGRRIAATDDALSEPHLVWIGSTSDTGETVGGPAVRLGITAPNSGRLLVWRYVADQPEPQN